MNVRERAEKNESYIIERRRYYHTCPELSGQEVETAKSIKADLEAMGVEVGTVHDLQRRGRHDPRRQAGQDGRAARRYRRR